MKRDLSGLFQQARDFILNIKNGERVFLFSHDDTDGITSAVIFKIGLEKLGKKIAKIFNLKIEESGVLFSELKRCKKAIVLDLPFDKHWKKFIASGKEILFIDHHTVHHDANSSKVIYMNPRLENPEIYQPIAYLSYKIFSSMMDAKEIWLTAALGTIADYGFDDCRDLFAGLKVKSRKELWESKYGQLVEKIYSAESILGPKKTFDILFSAKTMSSLNKNPQINSALKKYFMSYKRAKKEFAENAENFDSMNLIFSSIKSGLPGLGSHLCTEVATAKPDKIVIVMDSMNGMVKVHARYQSGKIHLGLLMKECCRKIGEGGGHRQAAGGSFERKYLDQFRNNLFHYLKSRS